jgi:hypothetical protein
MIDPPSHCANRTALNDLEQHLVENKGRADNLSDLVQGLQLLDLARQLDR